MWPTFCSLACLSGSRLRENEYVCESEWMSVCACVSVREREIKWVSKALFTRDILAHNISIKRYWDKKIFLSHGFQWLAKVSS